MSIVFLLYVADVVAGLGIVFTLVTLLSLVVGAIAAINAGDKNYKHESGITDLQAAFKASRLQLCISAVVLSLWTVLPSKTTIYALAAMQTMADVSTSPTAASLATKLEALLQAQLDSLLEKK
jgi:hypothetical protein